MRRPDKNRPTAVEEPNGHEADFLLNVRRQASSLIESGQAEAAGRLLEEIRKILFWREKPSEKARGPHEPVPNRNPDDWPAKISL